MNFPRVYFSGPVFAGPLSAEADQVLQAHVNWTIGEHHYEAYYSAGQPTTVDELDSLRRRIDECHLMVVDVRGIWAWWELGYAYARDLPIIQYGPPIERVAKPDDIVQQSLRGMVLARCKNAAELREALGMLRDSLVEADLPEAGAAMVLVGAKFPC